MFLREQLHILVVDDMAVSRGLLTQALDQLGIENYRYVANGQEALDFLKKTPVHLVLSDYNMPVMDGLDLLRAIRSTDSLAKLAFIMVSGFQDSRVVEQAALLGMNNYLQKPFDAESLQHCVEKVFGRL